MLILGRVVLKFVFFVDSLNVEGLALIAPVTVLRLAGDN